MHDYDPKTDVIFYSEVGRNGFGCWNTKNQLMPQNYGRIAHNNDTMIYPSDLQVRLNNTFFVISSFNRHFF
jgi:dopachrome tautomerase